MRLTPAGSCAEAFCGHFGGPREVTWPCEQFVYFLSQLLAQLASEGDVFATHWPSAPSFLRSNILPLLWPAERGYVGFERSVAK